jgi:hypothetical protein
MTTHEFEDTDRSAFIDRLLDDARPRTVYSNTDWIVEAGIPEKIAEFDEATGTVEAVLVRSAERDAKRAEGGRSKVGNTYVREWFETGEDPLDWSWLGPIPVKIDRKRKCRFDTIVAEDLEDAATFLQNVAKLNFDRALLTASAYRALARMARRAGLDMVAAIGDVTVEAQAFDVVDGEVIDEEADG